MVKMAMDKGTQTLVLTNRIELFKQNMRAIIGAGSQPQIVSADTKIFDPRSPVSVAMVETLSRRMKNWLPNYYNPEFIICDEAHLSPFFKVLDAFPNAKCIGATATPINKRLHLYYTNIVANVDIPELINDGHLVRCRHFQMQDDFSEVKITKGEYDEKQLFNHFDKKGLYAGVVDKYKEKAMGKKTLVFNCNIEHAEKTCAAFNAAGIRSEVVSSNTSAEERKRILTAFEGGYFPVLNNCSILTTGIDIPSIECIILNRATTSLALYLQMNGRGSRPYPNKTEFIILDFGMNASRFGLWSEAREWSLAPPKKKNKTGSAPVKNCPRCSAMLAASAMKCEFCEYVFIKKTTEEKNGVLVEISSNIPVGLKGKKLSEFSTDELLMLQKCKKLIHSHVWRIIRSRGELAIRNYAAKAGYKIGWVQNQIADMGDSKFRDYVLQ